MNEHNQQQFMPPSLNMLLGLFANNCTTPHVPVCSLSSTVCHDSKTPGSSSSDEAAGGAPSWAFNAGLLALWAGLMGYVFFLAPNQTPTIDAFVVQKLVG
jgi:hypothetical protein